MNTPRETNDGTPQPIHVYDDIQEEDNRLPSWWLGTLYGTVLFAFCYWSVYQVAHMRPSVIEIYRAEEAAAAKRAAAEPVSEKSLAAMAANPQVVGDAQRVFKQICSSCHGANAQGLVGPNLTDRFWLHGGAPMAIHNSINGGYPQKGMPSWGKILGPTRVRALAAYVVSLKGKNAIGKAPQGIEEK